MDILSLKGKSSGLSDINVDKNETIVGSRSDEVMPNSELSYRTASGQYATRCSLKISLPLANLLISFHIMLWSLSGTD